MDTGHRQTPRGVSRTLIPTSHIVVHRYVDARWRAVNPMVGPRLDRRERPCRPNPRLRVQLR
eukprot:1213640-Prymnesium_polylepis.1